MIRGRIGVALVMDHPAQQFTRGLQLLAAEPDVKAQVYYWSAAQQVHDAEFDRLISWDTDLLGGYAWAAAPPGRSLFRRLRWLISQLRQARPDVLVCYGWASPIARMSIIYCMLTGSRLLLYGDSTWQHSSGGRHRVLRSAALRILMRLCAGAVSTGTFNREFYIRHGMDPYRIRPGICPADTESFGSARAGRTEAPAASGEPLRIGFAGKLVQRKGVDELLRASALLPRAGNWSVSVIGDGPLMPELRALAGQLGIGDRVTFHGFANTSEMPRLLASFDVVVVPSQRDMRALISIEAMAAGAAIIVSDATAVWGQGDLVEHGVTGLVYPSGNPAALARELSCLLEDRVLLSGLRSRGTERAGGYGPDAFARTLACAARTCAATGKGREQ